MRSSFGFLFSHAWSRMTKGMTKWPKTRAMLAGVPAAGVADQEVGGLLRDVRIPDQEELGEGDVGPEDREGEQQLAHDVEVLGSDHFLQVAGLHQQVQDDDDHRHRVQRGPREEVDAPHRRKPRVRHPFSRSMPAKVIVIAKMMSV